MRRSRPTARPVNVDEMREGESSALLSKGVPGLDAARARELSRRLGEWPIALELASAMMRQRIEQGDSAEKAAQRLLQILDKRGPRGWQRAPETRDTATSMPFLRAAWNCSAAKIAPT